LSFAEYGDPDGSPAVFVPGAASGASMAFGGGVLVDRGIRLISFDRPGLGASESDPEKSVLSVGADTAELIDALIGRAVPVIANSQGAPFAIAAALQGAATRLILASPSDEVAFPAVTEQLPAHFQQLVASVNQGSALEAEQLFAPYTADSFFDMVMSDPVPSDVAVYSDASFRDRFRRVVQEAFAQGPLGYARDTALAMSPWRLDLHSVHVPVHILYGEDDDSHSPDQGEILASRFANASRVIVRRVGGSLLWACPDIVLDLCSENPGQ
jgi:pimeloyl-ACP methyl ester carboxylesterase